MKKTVFTFGLGCAFGVWMHNAHADFFDGVAAFERGDYATALEHWRPMAEEGIAVAQNNLGVMYDHGLGVEEDDAQAVQWYRLAAKQGNAQSQYSLGLMYGNGHGVPEDDRAAVKWYRLAADQGSVNAQYHMALVYDFGEGVREDDSIAATWYRKAADVGDSRAQYNLGLLYDFGSGVKQDKREALKWYRKAARQGDAKAQYMVGASHFNGEGTPKDRVKGYAWLTLAAYQRHVRAIQHRAEVWATLTPREREEAKSLRKQLAGKLALLKRLGMPVSADAAPNLVPKEVLRQLQVALHEHGFEPGPTDGLMGPRTRDAIRAFQRSVGLAETGEPSRDLLQLIRIQ